MESRRRVLVITSLGPRPYVGGIENVVDTLLESDLKERFSFATLDTFRAGDPERSIWSKFTFAFSLFGKTRRALKQHDPDLVHIHFCSKVDFWKHSICLWVSRVHRKRIIFHLHGGSFDRFYENKGAFMRRVIRSIYRMPDVVVALSDYWKTFLSGLMDAEKVRVINNPVPCDRLAPDGARQPDRARPGILLLGSLGRRKGHYESIRALGTVVGRHRGARLLLAGGEEDFGAKEALTKLCAEVGVADHVEFLGPVGFERKVELLRTCAMLILPSHAENMPISLLEAMAAGVPVVATRVGAVPEVLGSGDVGQLIDAGDSAALADAICGFLDDPDAAEAAGRRARELARRRWDVGKIAGDVDAVYGELLGAASAPG